MSTIVTRAGKGSPLTNTEVDTNFTNLNTDKYQSGDSPTFVDIIADSIQFTGGTGDQGTISWNTDEETIDVIMDGSVLQVGQEVVYNVRNNSGSTIPDGTPVMATGTIGASSRITVSPMDGTDIDNSRRFIGITTEEIANDADGKVTFFGKVRGIDLTSYSDGDILWISTSTAGAFTATEPTSGTRIAFGFVISNASNGTMFVRADNGHALHESHDVTITTPSANDVLAYDGSKWVNVSSLTLSSLTVGGTAFTDKIELDDLSVTTGSPSGGGSLSYSNTTGVFTYVPADPSSGSVTSVAATVPTGFTVSGSPITTSGTIAIAFDTGYALPTTASQANWDTAYGWGDHSGLYATAAQGSLADSAVQPGDNVSDLTNDAGYLTSETYTGTVTSVGGTGTVNGLTLTGTVTSSGNLTLGGTLSGIDLTSQITGTLPIANGGTGLTSLGTSNQVLKVNSGATALEYGDVDSLPSQTGNSGYFLTTDGTNPSWAEIDALPDQTDNSGKYLTTDGTEASWDDIAQVAYTRTTYTATSGQVNFAASYDAGYVDVFLNGIKLLEGTDFTASGGSNIALTAGATLNDIVEILAYTTASIVSQVKNPDGGFANSVYTIAQNINGGTA